MLNNNDNFKLTRRETHVLHLLSEGLTCKQISKILDVAQTTVTTHVERMKFKLEVRNSIELIYITSKLGLV